VLTGERLANAAVGAALMAFASARLDELTAIEIMKRPDLLRDLPHGSRVPEAGGPATAAESLLWDSRARYDRMPG
jgi:hypothetical protein